MRVKYPALTAVLDQHTVDTGRGVMAGFLVRCTASQRELGHVWQTGNVWRWRTPDQHSGERATQRAAVQVLREAHDLRSGPQRPLPFSGDPTVSEITTAWRQPIVLPKMKPKAPPLEQLPPRRPTASVTAPEPPPVKKIVWSTQPGVTDALDAAIRRHSTLKK
jgi:hypothetical protein